MSPTEAAIGAGVVALTAALAGVMPQRLAGEAGGWKAGALMALAAAVVGWIVLAGVAAFVRWDAAVALAVLATLLAAMAAFDVRHFIVPDLHVVLIAVLGFAGPIAPPLPEALIGAVLGAGLLGLVRYLYRRARGVQGLGLGDVKLALALGAVAGPQGLLWIVLGGAALGLVYGLARGGGRGYAAPFGAAMAAPAFAVALFGQLA